jgi:hypothetical protein
MAAPPTWLKFDSDYTDSGTNALTGTAQGSGNSFDTTNKQQGTASLLTNGSGYATYGDNIDLSWDDAFTLSFWCRFTGTGSQTAFVGKITDWGPHTNKGWLLVMLGNGTNIYWQQNNGTSFNVNEVQRTWSATTLNNGSWHHVVLTKTTSGSASGLTLYVDNSTASVLGTDADTLSSGTTANSQNLAVAAQSTGNTKYTGNIDSVKILKGTTWSAGDVSTEYNDPNQSYVTTYVSIPETNTFVSVL